MTTAKTDLRRRLRRCRAALAVEERAAESAAVVATLLPLLNEAPTLASYQALSDEVDLTALHHHWWRLGRPVWLPRVVRSDLTWHPVVDPDDCRPGAFGIREPDPARIPALPLPADAVILVPGVAFDARGGRLGQGKGFYDRALATHPGRTIGVGFTCQEVPEVPREAHDIPLDLVILGWRVLTPG